MGLNVNDLVVRRNEPGGKVMRVMGIGGAGSAGTGSEPDTLHLGAVIFDRVTPMPDAHSDEFRQPTQSEIDVAEAQGLLPPAPA